MKSLHAMKPRDPRPMKEEDLQRYLVQLLKFNAHPKVTAWAVPNGEARSKVTGSKLKSLGVLPGVADFAVVLPDGITAYLELKTFTGRQSPEQRAFQARMTLAGAPYAVCRTPEEVFSTLGAWGALKSRSAAASVEA